MPKMAKNDDRSITISLTAADYEEITSICAALTAGLPGARCTPTAWVQHHVLQELRRHKQPAEQAAPAAAPAAAPPAPAAAQKAKRRAA